MIKQDKNGYVKCGQEILHHTSLLDSRSRDRYVNKDYLVNSDIVGRINDGNDLVDTTQPVSLTQPAIGTFDEETLKRVQSTFPYLKYKKESK